jgi:VIT1/CCC1 family predicted Fe2+/Mn2+ transporter
MFCCRSRHTPRWRQRPLRLILIYMKALFAIGAAVLLLLFVGIHNAWDAVTYHVFVSKPTA